MAASIVRLGGEQKVNNHTANGQEAPSITALADGGWVVTWTSNGQDGSGYGIYQQRYNADGSLRGAEQRVNTYTTDNQASPSVTALEGGGWVVTWTSNGQDGSGYGIYQQRYKADGSPVTDGPYGGERKVNTYTMNDQSTPSVTALEGGGWVVTWMSVDQDTGFFGGIFQQRYNADGSPVTDGPYGGERQVNTYTLSDQMVPSVTALKGGGCVVTWMSVGQDAGVAGGIYQQRYNADGSPVTDGPYGGEQRVNTYTADNQASPSVTALEDGGWIVTWTSNGQDGSGYGIYQQRYNADGSLRGTEQRVNTYTNLDQMDPSVTALEDGGWIVTWTSNGQDGSGYGIYQQRYNADGALIGSKMQVHSYTTSHQRDPSVTALADGSWVVTWTSNGQDGSDLGIYQQRFTPVAAFGEGKEHGIGMEDDDVFLVRNGGLSSGDSLEAGGGIDTLRMIETGALDLSSLALLTGIEIVQGSSGDDIILTNAAHLAGIVGFRGGSGNDALHLKAGHYDFTTRVASGMEAITLLGTGSIAFADKATAMLARSQPKDGQVILQDDSFTLTERTQLYHQGIRKVTDASGVHVLQEVQASLSTQAVTENAGAGTVIGTLSAIDPTPGDGLRFELTDNAGGRFALSGNQLVVANGSLLDYEAGASHRIVVRIIDEGGIATDAAFTITLSDVPVENLKGTSQDDVLKGGIGRDVLYGGSGKDTLTGDAGQDVFVFDAKPNKKSNLDKITDFNVADDTLWLDNAIFTKLGKTGSELSPAALNKKFFVVGTKAKDKNDYLVYDKKKGVLYYDADGSGSKKAVEIATLSKNLKLTDKDFFVV